MENQKNTTTNSYITRIQRIQEVNDSIDALEELYAVNPDKNSQKQLLILYAEYKKLISQQ